LSGFLFIIGVGTKAVVVVALIVLVEVEGLLVVVVCAFIRN
jgi:hypothetical protein